MSVWFKEYTLQDVIAFANRSQNMSQTVGMQFIELGDNYVKAKMPVDHRTMTPAGLWHGGASCVLAETIGSTASYLCVDPTKQAVVGIEINANHIKSLTTGYVVGTATALHVGRSIHVWDIRIEEEHTQKLVCVSRLTVKVLKKD